MIREATTDDGPKIKAIFLAMIEELSHQHGHDIAPTEINAESFWQFVFLPAIESGKHAIMVCDDIPAAVFIVPERYLAVQPSFKRGIDWGCYVAPEHRRKGIGTGLRLAACEKMKALGYSKVTSNVMVTNRSGLESYRKIGAKIVGYMTELEI